MHVDHGLSKTRARPGVREALAACSTGDVLVVTKLDRFARSLRDVTDIADKLTKKSVDLNLGGAVYDPTDTVSRLLFNVLVSGTSQLDEAYRTSDELWCAKG